MYSTSQAPGVSIEPFYFENTLQDNVYFLTESIFHIELSKVTIQNKV